MPVARSGISILRHQQADAWWLSPSTSCTEANPPGATCARLLRRCEMGEPSWCGLCRCPPTVLWAMSGGAADVSFTKRAAQELSRCFNGLNVRTAAKSQGTAATASFYPGNETQHLLQCRGARVRIACHNKFKERLDIVPHARTLTELWLEPAFLTKLFKYVNPKERSVLAQVRYL
ncbi:hypothetical protein TNCV_5120381 [Trichonephila clavipes]|nr:hypothetical protein TNCV_5120381 [Trichonephila clavipes]